MSRHDAETSGGLDDGGEVVGGHGRSAGVLLEYRRLYCCLSTLCGRQSDSERVYCYCIHFVHVSEREVGMVAVNGSAAREAGQALAERMVALGLEVVVLRS